KLGRVNFVTSCSAKAQSDFERGLALLHSFWFEQAEKSFHDAAQADPHCGIAWWGMAASHYHPLWEPPTPAELAAGSAFIAEAGKLSAPTQRERDFIAALADFYRDYRHRPHAERARAWSDAMARAHQHSPDDSEATMFYALSLIAIQSPTDKTYAQYRRAGELLIPIFDRQPGHPGVAHYVIHACDAPPLAHMGLAAARRYAQIAPSVPHALHMPSHIFTRLGYWEDSIASNRAAASAGEAYARAEHATAGWTEALHALDYLAYAYLQSGQDSRALAVVREAAEIGAGDGSLKAGYPLAAIPARYALERRDWKAAAALQPAPGAPAVPPAIRLWARSIGAARSNQLDKARAGVTQLAAMRDALAKQEPYWSGQVEIMRLEAASWLALAEKEPGALELARAAADKEDSADKSNITPGSVLPARELLADLLLELKQPAQALAEYEASLQSAPRRFNSLYGAARAAELAGNKEKARTYYTQLHDVARNGERKQIEFARKAAGIIIDGPVN